MQAIIKLVNTIQAILSFIPQEQRKKTADAILDAIEANNAENKRVMTVIGIVRLVIGVPDEDETVAG